MLEFPLIIIFSNFCLYFSVLIFLRSGGLLLAYVHADFSPECQQMDEVIRALALDAQFANVTFIKVLLLFDLLYKYLIYCVIFCRL